MKHQFLVGALVLSAAWCVQPSVWAEPEWKKGILLEPLVDKGVSIGQAGQVLTYRSAILKTQSGRGMDGIVVQIGGKQLTHEDWWLVLPYDQSFSPAWVLRHLQVDGDAGVSPDSPERFRVEKNKLALLDAVLREFPRHRLIEDLWFVRIEQTALVENLETGSKAFPHLKKAILDYLSRFPNGRFKAKAEWRLIQLRTEPYEYEGDVFSILESVTSYETYLKRHPGTPCSDEIRLRIAHLYRMAFESLTNIETAGYNASDEIAKAADYLKRAESLYLQLLQSANVDTVTLAQIHLFNLRAGRRAYINANDF